VKKRILDLAISLIVGIWDLLSDMASWLVGRRPTTRCVVLAYHAVSPDERSQFSRQMDVLLRHARPVRADAAALPAGGGWYAAVTFDDGLESIIDNALPVLKEKGIPVTLFIVTDILGRNRDWEHRGGDDTRHERVMSEEQLRKLPSELVAIGSHTMTHPFLPSLECAQLQQELTGSRLKLERMLDRRVTLLSFPYGAFDDRIIEDCREAGYERVFTALPVFGLTTPGEFVTGRVGVAPGEWPIEFRLKLAGAYRWLPYAYSLKRRVLSVVRGQAAQRVEKKVGEKRVA
jgi:peptidoglycan/xylan/chitin deacetylase (PgdA/CDA1 family)